VARNTQLFLQGEGGLHRLIDAYGGSAWLEQRTEQLIEKAREYIREVEELGGMARAIEAGIPKQRIEEAAARRQARIDSGADRIVGVNVFPPDETTPLDLLEVDNTAVLSTRMASLAQVKASRDADKVRAALAAITDAAAGTGNLLASAIKAARARATLGEISDAMEPVFGRYVATTRLISGVYAKEISMNDAFRRARASADDFAERVGRRPRIMIAKLGQDGHDRGAKVIATSFADLGWDVDVGPLFQTPAEAALQAVENDVHILGISSLAAGHKVLVPETIEALRTLGRPDIGVVVGGIIPEHDHAFLHEQGVMAIFGPGTVIAEAAIKLLEKLKAKSEK
jgi:methylmalonyl-CoA mutase